MTEPVLFIGGPWDGSRNHMPMPLPWAYVVAPTPEDVFAELPDQVVYQLRYQGDGSPAYVAPDQTTAWPR